MLSFLPGNAVGTSRPWPAWVRSDDALVQVARWLRTYHAAVVDLDPPVDAVWREGGQWRPGLIVGHNDAAPNNAAWGDQGQLIGFFGWDFAAPVSLEWDLSFTAFAWVPCTRHLVQTRGLPPSSTDLDASSSSSTTTAGAVTQLASSAPFRPASWPLRTGSSAPRAAATWPTNRCSEPASPTPYAQLQPSSPQTPQTSTPIPVALPLAATTGS